MSTSHSMGPHAPSEDSTNCNRNNIGIPDSDVNKEPTNISSKGPLDPKTSPENGLVPLGLAMIEPEKDSVYPFTQDSAHNQPSPDNKCELCNENFKTPANGKKHVRLKHASPIHVSQGKDLQVDLLALKIELRILEKSSHSLE